MSTLFIDDQKFVIPDVKGDIYCPAIRKIFNYGFLQLLHVEWERQAVYPRHVFPTDRDTGCASCVEP